MMELCYNNPKIRQAQIMADKMGESQAIVRNCIGGLDIKPESKVSVIYNDDILAVITPKMKRSVLECAEA